MKILFVVGLAALLTAPLVAQHQSDPDKKVAGGGTLPTGWKAQIDDSAPIAGVMVMPMGSGLHFMTGPAGIYYRPADKAMGTYEVRATFTQMEPAAHPEAYGIIIGGMALEGVTRKYTYFLIRQDGKYLVKRRVGIETPTIVDWTDNAAIKKADTAGKMTNTLAIDVAKDKVRFLVNGTEVASTGPAKVDTDGVAGLRINHNLNVHVEGFGVKTR